MCVGGGKLERGHRDEVMKGLKSYAKYWYFICGSGATNLNTYSDQATMNEARE